MDRSITVGGLLRWWLDTYVAGESWADKEESRFRLFFESHEIARLPLVSLSSGVLGLFLQAGLRKGELFGLRCADVDLPRRLLMVRRSYDGTTTKGAREEAVPIAAGLVPHLEAALKAATGELLFPRADGSMRTKDDDLRDRLRRAIGRAGCVTGYLHSCRRCKAAGLAQEPQLHPDNARRRCGTCNAVLWAKTLPRPFRLHDTRHTTATLLLTAGVDLYAVARILRHSDPKVTFET